MKSFLLFIAFLCAVTLSSSSTPSVTNAANAVKKERAVMKFNQPVTLMGRTLKGEYLIVHDDLAMARGEACTYVYEGVAEVQRSWLQALSPHACARRVYRQSLPCDPCDRLEFSGALCCHLSFVTCQSFYV